VTVGDILNGIRTVIAGGATLDASIAKFILRNLRRRLPKPGQEIDLSKREIEILTLLGEGLVKKEIAERLQIGYSTVDTHVGHIYLKLQVKNAPAAITKAYRMGIFSNNDGSSRRK
ncbi:MAG: response regulator transcription factor, partial [Verrucomicrobiae bacterium]|nr:response regulator transcription factor [Verrucomicrobiae bacterium]